MVEDVVTDGARIAQLLASEMTGRADPPFDGLAVANADADAAGTPDGEFAYEIRHDGDLVAEVFVHPERARIEFRERVEAAAEAAEREGLRVRPKAVRPPRTLVFVESGVEVKRAVDVLAAAFG